MGARGARSSFAVAAAGLALGAGPLDRPVDVGADATVPASPARHVAPDWARAVRAPGRPGRLRVVSGRSRVHGSGPVRRFRVEVEGGLRVDPAAFARAVEAILFDRRSWAARGGFALRRVSAGRVDFRVALASPALTDRLCSPLTTHGRLSCMNDRRAVLNFRRWEHGARAYGDRLRAYRTYLVNHEVGHAFGHSHATCPAPHAKAPVMMQQTKGVGACRPNPWPLRSESG